MMYLWCRMMMQIRKSVALALVPDKCLMKAMIAGLLWHSPSKLQPEVMRTLVDMAYAPNLCLVATDPQAIVLDDPDESPNTMQRVAMSPDGSKSAVVIANAYMDKNGIPPDVLIFNVETGDVIQRFTGHSIGAFDVQYAHDGQTIVTGSPNGEIIQWDVNAGEETLRYDVPPQLVSIGEHRGNLEIGRKNLWHYEGQAGETLTIRVNPDAPADVREWPEELDPILQHIADNNHLPPILTLKPVDGDIITEHNSGIEPIDSLSNGLLEEIVLPADGVYEIEISTYENLYGGAYTLIIESN
jgi:WD40 repeat protein